LRIIFLNGIIIVGTKIWGKLSHHVRFVMNHIKKPTRPRVGGKKGSGPNTSQA
jgi:hypothetical protein